MAIKLRSAKFLNAPALKVRSVSAAYTVDLNSDYLILPNTTAASRTITLPPIADAYDALSQTGRQYIIQKPIAANSVIIEGNAAETINGAANQTLTTQYSSAILVAGPTEWIMYATDLIDAATLGAGSIDSTMILNGTIATADIGASQITNALMADDAIDSAEIADGAVDPVHLASGFRLLSADAALTLAATDRTIELNITTGTTVATMTATHAGHRVTVSAGVRSGGAYTLACTRGATSGSVTLDAAGEGCELVYSGSAWRLVALTGGSTFA